jgi:hypothetical protein
MSSADNALSAKDEYPSHTRLRGVTLLMARIVTFSVIVLILAALCVSIPVYVSDTSVICTNASCPIGRLTPASVAALSPIGISAHTYVYGTLILDGVCVVAWLGAAGLILWRISPHWDGLLLATLLVTQGGRLYRRCDPAALLSWGILA